MATHAALLTNINLFLIDWFCKSNILQDHFKKDWQKIYYMPISFNELPEAIENLGERLSNIENLLKQKQPKNEPKNKWFDLPGLCEYLPSKPAKQTVYQWVNDRKIPHHKTGKKLRFLKSEIDTWLLAGRRATIDEIEAQAGNYIK